MKKKGFLILLILIVLVGAGIAVRSLTAVTYAAGYFYQDENRILYAKVLPGKEGITLEINEAQVETVDGLPQLKNNRYLYEGTVEGESLKLHAAEGQGESLAASVNRERLVLQDTWREHYEANTELLAMQTEEYQTKLDALQKQVSEKAEAVQKEMAERKAQEKAEMNKKVEQFGKLESDIAENIKYISEYQISGDLAIFEQHLTDLASLSEELASMGPKSGLTQTDRAIASSIANSMNALMDGVRTLQSQVEKKTTALSGIAETLQGDMNQAQVLWQQVSGEIANRSERQKAFEEAVQAGTEAIAEAKKSVAAAEQNLAGYKKKAEGYYQKAADFLKE
ncbi:hypothetical protein NDK47_17990 [Brevibacillus ruminantium]|uniref:Uncharacterized protein n=1 Tax=Brevibacillus ruminantium TaxID=2950604 RepID=A0ABY4WA47_9BACL|nr:hypothetical protein [Brevibacillus ruminantium]USG64040.1 hypothetical protein NDK47_17990 [Brevibacillus ruminantium]